MPTGTPHFRSLPVRMIDPDAYTVATYTATIDTRRYKHGSFILQYGTNAGAVTAKMQEGDLANGTDAADITGAAFTVLTAGNDDGIAYGSLYLPPRKRYITVEVVLDNSTDFSFAGVLSGREQEPIGGTDFNVTT